MNQFDANIINQLKHCRVLIDVGGGGNIQKDWGDKRMLFSDCQYISIDRSISANVDVFGDCHHLPIRSEIADGVICQAVLEHVENPFQVIGEMYRVLKKGGVLYAYVPFLYPYHPGKNYGDYFRFTRGGVELLFRNFSRLTIRPARSYPQTMLNLLPIPFKNLVGWIARPLDLFFTSQDTTSGWSIVAVK